MPSVRVYYINGSYIYVHSERKSIGIIALQKVFDKPTLKHQTLTNDIK